MTDAEKIRECREWLDKWEESHSDTRYRSDWQIIQVCRKLLDACEWYSREAHSRSEMKRWDMMDNGAKCKALEECAKEIE